MPTYGYRCQSCGVEFDVWQRMADEPGADCPTCGGKGKRLIYPVGLVFKGSGFYKTDSRKAASPSAPAAAAAGAKDGAADKPATTPSPAKADGGASGGASPTKADGGGSGGASPTKADGGRSGGASTSTGKAEA